MPLKKMGNLEYKGKKDCLILSSKEINCPFQGVEPVTLASDYYMRFRCCTIELQCKAIKPVSCDNKKWILHGRAKIRNFSPSVETSFTFELSEYVDFLGGLLRQRRHLLCYHSNGDLFTREDIMFRAKAHPIFHCCSFNKYRSPAFASVIKVDGRF